MWSRLARAHGVTVSAHAAAIVAAYDRDPTADLTAQELMATPPQLRPPTSIKRAFNLMVKMSQDTNTPVRIIAERIVDTP